jgi:3-phenylpropionate/cinnamic acid dioxygenase small subunit
MMDRIAEAYYEYADAFDKGDLDRFVSLFAAECRFDESPKARDHQWIRARVAKLREPFEASSHHISNVRVLSEERDEVHATASAYTWQRRRAGGDVEGWGRYDTLFRLEDGAWRFALHRIEVVGRREVELPTSLGVGNQGKGLHG